MRTETSSSIQEVSRRSFLGLFGAAAGAAVAPGLVSCAAGGPSSSTIKAGSILDATGNLALYGKPMSVAAKAAVKDINDAGGVLGKRLELVSVDTQSQIDKYTTGARQFAANRDIVVVHGGVTSASREAMRPVMHASKKLYFYNNLYEGGVCDLYTYATGGVPTQQIEVLVPYLIETFGPRVYIVAADYNYGRILALWVKKYLSDKGGELVGEQYFPLEVNEFGDALSRIQAARPDVVCSLLVGANHNAFYTRFQAAGLTSSMGIASTVLGYGGEQADLDGQVVKDIVVALPYFQEVEGSENQRFVRAVKAADPSLKYVSDNMNSVWTGWHMWAQAVEKAGSTDVDAVIEQLNRGMTYDSPSGTVELVPETHHLTQTIRLARANSTGGFDILKTVEGVKPVFELEKCDLIDDPSTNEQFTP